MTSPDFEQRMRELLARIEELPPEERAPLYALARETRARQERIESHRARSEAALADLHDANLRLKRRLAHLQDRLSDLSLNAKLALFDLEARRREREAGG